MKKHSEKLKDPSLNAEGQEEKSFFGIIIHSFFVVPFLIAVFGVLLFTAVRLLTLEKHTIYDYLNDIKTGSLSKRWQSAFELSKMVTNPDLIPKEEKFVSELVNAFDHSKHDDDRIRQYLALAMGRTANTRFVEPLLNALREEKFDNLYAIIYALGMLRDKRAVNNITEYVDNPDPKLRLVSIMSLGNIGDRESLKILKKALHDNEINVGWDAAIALAKMRDWSGKAILLNLLDRNYLSKFSEVDAQEQTHVLLVTIEAVAKSGDPDLNHAVEILSQNDQNMNVRKSALAALK